MSSDLSSRIANLSPEKRALLAERLKKPAAPVAEPIAIVGIGCRFPGADGPEAFWQLVRDGVDAVREVPADRWDIEALYDPDPAATGKMMSRCGGFLDRIDGFDAAFFGISPREASRMDPQQRLLLEVAWEAFEHAGQTREALKGSQTGVFVGVHSQSADYTMLQYIDIERMDAFTGTGTAHNFLSGRLSYLFDLHGPSLVVDTACSSSLVAVHLACQSLRAGDCALAVAGGVNLMVTPHFTVVASRMRLLSPDGRCKTFDEKANGYVRGEGCGVVILKKLSDAQADGDRVIAVIRGSAVNQDGRTNGITAPNGLSQRAAIREALRSGGIAPSRVSYVETHGTGTALGDPIEVESIAAELGEPVEGAPVCALGSTKANIGHLEGAAGVAGLIRAALCLQHREIPPVVHFTRLNPHISLSNTRLEVPAARRDWPATAEPRVAGVSSFGWCGTNAHAVLEEAPAAPVDDAKPSPSASSLFPLSAGDPEALKALALRYASAIESGGHSLESVLRSAALKRSHLEHRLAIVAETRAELIDRLRACGTGEGHPQAAAGHAAAQPGGIVFVFPGQGSQWLGMGRQLAATEPVFRQALEQCDRAIAAVVGWSVIEELHADGDRSKLSQIDVVQPTLFAVSVALAALWRSWGIEPDAVVGHSMGEIAAAHVAGALTIDDAARIICLRSRLLRTVSGKGAMAVVELSMADTATALQGFEDRLSIAVSNSRRSTVVSGDPVALDLFMARQRDADVFCRPVKVDVASHSPQMDPLRAPLLEALAGIAPALARIPIYSTVLDGVVRGDELVDTYWVRNLREPVLFSSSVERLIADGHLNFVEVSAHPLLLPAIETALQESSADAGLVVASARREESERTNLLMSLGRLYANGCAVRWEAVTTAAPFQPGPMYPWQHERFWLEEPVGAGASRAQGQLPVPGAIVTAGSERICAVEWAPRPESAATALRVGPDRVVPAAILTDLVFETGLSALGVEVAGIRDLEFLRPLTLDEDGSVVSLQITLGVAGEAGVPFRLALRDSGIVLDLMIGVLETGAAAHSSVSAVDDTATPAMDADAFYRDLRAGGVDVDPVLQLVEQARRTDSGQVISVRLPHGPARARRIATLESAFQALAASVAEPGGPAPYVPERIGALRYRNGAGESAAVRTVRFADTVSAGTTTESGTSLSIENAFYRRRGNWSANPSRWLYELAWQPVVLAGAPVERTTQSWLILNDASGVSEAIAAGLSAAGHLVWRAATLDEAVAILRTDATFSSILDCSGIDLASVAGEPVDASVDRIDAALLKAIGLVQSIASRAWPHPPRLWWLTKGAQAVPVSTPCDPAASALWGLGRVVAEEHAEIWGGMIDLDPRADGTGASIVTELTSRANEHQVAFRDGLRYAARFASHAAAPAVHIGWRRDASYLITGGLTGVGLRVADWMVQRGARHLVLAGRTPLPPRHEWATTHARDVAARIAGVRMLESRGATVHLLAVDVSNEADMRAALERFEREGWPSVRGVVHCAAVVDDALIAKVGTDGLRRVLVPKIGGALVLDRLFADVPLDFFVLFSSIGSVLGNSGQASYAAGNAYLDGLACARSSRGLPGQAISWAGWRGLGLADTSQGARRTIENLERWGIGGFEPTEGLEALWRVMSRTTAHAVILPLDLEAFRRSRWAAADPHLFSELIPAEGSAPTAAGSATDLRTRLSQAAPETRRGMLETFLQQQLSMVLKLPLDRIDVQQPLGALGLESLMALEFRNRLEPELKIKLSATVVWNHPTVRALATYIAGRLDLSLEKTADLETPAAASVAHVPAIDAAVEELSEDAALAALLQATQGPR